MADVYSPTPPPGVPATIPIDNTKRLPRCDARQATFQSIEGEYALYRGVCDVGHAYNERIKIKEIIKPPKELVVNKDGKIEEGVDPGYVVKELTEY